MKTCAIQPRLAAFCACLIAYGIFYHWLCKYASLHTYVIVTGTLPYVLIVVILWMIFNPLKKHENPNCDNKPTRGGDDLRSRKG